MGTSPSTPAATCSRRRRRVLTAWCVAAQQHSTTSFTLRCFSLLLDRARPLRIHNQQGTFMMYRVTLRVQHCHKLIGRDWPASLDSEDMSRGCNIFPLSLLYTRDYRLQLQSEHATHSTGGAADDRTARIHRRTRSRDYKHHLALWHNRAYLSGWCRWRGI